MIELKIKIPTIKDFWIWCNNNASDYDRENRMRVCKVRDDVLWHISREPIPDENKKYLTNAIKNEFNKLTLKRCIWPVKMRN